MVMRGDIPHDLRIKVAAVLRNGGFSFQILFQHELQRTDDGVERRFLRNGCQRVTAHFQQCVTRHTIFLRKVPRLALCRFFIAPDISAHRNESHHLSAAGHGVYIFSHTGIADTEKRARAAFFDDAVLFFYADIQVAHNILDIGAVGIEMKIIADKLRDGDKFPVKRHKKPLVGYQKINIAANALQFHFYPPLNLHDFIIFKAKYS